MVSYGAELESGYIGMCNFVWAVQVFFFRTTVKRLEVDEALLEDSKCQLETLMRLLGEQSVQKHPFGMKLKLLWAP